MEKDLFRIGKIINTHGLKGELKIFRISDFDNRFKVGNILYITPEKATPIEVKIKSHRIHKGFDLVTFEEFNHINDVEKYKGSDLKIAADQLTDLAENEYYYYEIIDCEVFDMTGELIGVVKEILTPGANDVWVLKRANKKDALIPYIKDIVKKIDVKNKRIEIEPMEGLLD